MLSSTQFISIQSIAFALYAVRCTMCTIFNSPWLWSDTLCVQCSSVKCVLTSVQCVQSSKHHVCEVTPFTSCPFSLLVYAAVLPSWAQDNIIVGRWVRHSKNKLQSSMHHLRCEVAPFTSCPFSLLVYAAVLPRTTSLGIQGIQKPRSPLGIVSPH